MIVYLSIPFIIGNEESEAKAVRYLTASFTALANDHPKLVPVNALMSMYRNEEFDKLGKSRREDIYYGCARLLLDSSKMLIFSKIDGWEYDEVMRNECSYAVQHLKLDIQEGTISEQKSNR